MDIVLEFIIIIDGFEKQRLKRISVVLLENFAENSSDTTLK